MRVREGRAVSFATRNERGEMSAYRALLLLMTRGGEVRTSEVLYSFCGGWVSCRRMAVRLAVCVRSSKNAGHNEVSLHLGLLLVLGSGAEVRPHECDVFSFYLLVREESDSKCTC